MPVFFVCVDDGANLLYPENLESLQVQNTLGSDVEDAV